MNPKILLPLLAITPCSLFAGEPTPLIEETKEDLFKFSVDARARIEQRNAQGKDNSFAGTFRVRPGIFVGKDEGFAAFVETEHTIAFIDDYQVNQPGITPHDPANTPMGDPENSELNQLYAQYKGFGGLARVGRQRIIYDNAAFIGNVGWRQNEQTYDAAHVDFDISSVKVKYAYMNRVNRIFGSDAVGGVKSLQGGAHIFNASHSFGEHKATGYVYLMDFDEQNYGVDSAANNNTYGGYTDLKTSFGDLHIEGAYQSEAGDKTDYDAAYAHLIYTKKMGSFKWSFATEYLGKGFVTPLSTVHKFGGFADVFIGERLGLTAEDRGLTDIHTGIATKCGDMTFKSTIHGFFDDSMNKFYGWEVDAVAIKPITEDIKALAKFAQYFGDDSGVNGYDNDVTQFSVELNYSF